MLLVVTGHAYSTFNLALEQLFHGTGGFGGCKHNFPSSCVFARFKLVALFDQLVHVEDR